MAYGCSSCGIENTSPKELVRHMVEKHDSPFLEGDERLIALSAQVVRELNDKNKSAKLAEKFADHGRVI